MGARLFGAARGLRCESLGAIDARRLILAGHVRPFTSSATRKVSASIVFATEIQSTSASRVRATKASASLLVNVRGDAESDDLDLDDAWVAEGLARLAGERR